MFCLLLLVAAPQRQDKLWALEEALRTPGVGAALAELALDQLGLAAHGVAHEEGHALGQAQAPTVFLQHVAQCAAGDGFAVDQHTIASKQNGFKGHGA